MRKSYKTFNTLRVKSSAILSAQDLPLELVKYSCLIPEFLQAEQQEMSGSLEPSNIVTRDGDAADIPY